MRKLALIFLAAGTIWGCQTTPADYETTASDPEFLRRSIYKLTDVMVHDIFSPPAASRVYAYPSIAAYEAMAVSSPDYQSLAGQLHGLEEIPQPEEGEEYSYSLASIRAFLATARKLIFSEEMIREFEEEIYGEFKATGMPSDVYERSIAYGDAVSAHIWAWAGKDNYNETRTFPKYTIDTDEEYRWQPTPPGYMDGIEPHWNQIRTFVLDSATQYIPIRPTEYDMSENSLFYKEVMEVYEVGLELDEEQREIASFWDCNPYVMNTRGHLMFATKKITPGAHWMLITSIVTRQENDDFMTTSEAYARVAIALADAFISCWDEKYRSVLIRPETVINKYIDEDWKPLLQTPPFPEYTSGHSVISTAAAMTLTELYGETFNFNDTSELAYGLPARSFNSFMEASAEAAVSRLYGGIHYMPAISNGVDQGKRVGEFVNTNIKTRREDN